MKTDIQIRNVTDDIYGAVIALLTQSFDPTGSDGYTREYFTKHQRHDPSYSYDQASVIIEDGKVVSHLQVFHRLIRYGAGRIHVGAVADVATAADHRRKGYATRLLQRAIRYMDEQDLSLSLLYTGTQSLYETSGWHIVPATIMDAEVPTDVKPRPRAYITKPFEKSHFRLLAGYYQEAMSNLIGPLDRSTEYFENQMEWLSARGKVYWDVIYKVGHPAGFIRTSAVQGTLQLLDVCGTSEEVIRVACAQAVQRAIETGCKRITGHVPPDSLLTREFANFADITVREDYSQMMRLNNLEGTLRSALPEFHRRRRHSPLADRSILFKVGDFTTKMAFPSATATIDTSGNRDVEVLELTEKQFLHLLMGVKGSLKPVLEANLRPSIRSQLCNMFPQTGHVFWSADAF